MNSVIERGLVKIENFDSTSNYFKLGSIGLFLLLLFVWFQFIKNKNNRFYDLFFVLSAILSFLFATEVLQIKDNNDSLNGLFNFLVVLVIVFGTILFSWGYLSPIPFKMYDIRKQWVKILNGVLSVITVPIWHIIWILFHIYY